MELDTEPVSAPDPQQVALDATAQEGWRTVTNGALALEAVLEADWPHLSGPTKVAFRSAISGLREQVSDGEASANAAVSASGVDAYTATKAVEARMTARQAAYEQVRDNAIEDLLAASVPAIPEHTPSAKVAAMGGLLRDAIKSGAKVEKLVTEAIARNDDVALHTLLGDDLWPLYVAQGVDLRALRVSAAEQRWAAGQSFPGSRLLASLCGDAADLGAISRGAGVARFNATKRAEARKRR
jgi:hypothetical protein